MDDTSQHVNGKNEAALSNPNEADLEEMPHGNEKREDTGAVANSDNNNVALTPSEHVARPRRASRRRPISPRQHGLIDYALVGALLVLPSALGLPKKVRRLYAAEAAALLAYIALTDHPTSVAPLIPFRIHGRIDPLNVANFAAHSLLPSFRKSTRSLLFNTVFTLIAGATVAFTDWDARPVRKGLRKLGQR